MHTQHAPIAQSVIDRSTLLQSGGEGAVYAHHGKAIKLYHRPLTQHGRKLLALTAPELISQIPAHVHVPQRLVVDERQRIVGFEMPLLPSTARALKKLTHNLFCVNRAITMQQEIQLLCDLAHDLQSLHDAGIVVGDLNDHNVYFDWPVPDNQALRNSNHLRLKRFWIDVDSFQFAGFPCPVALTSYLDPHLYDVPDLAARPMFSRESDWYAFAVLVCKLLLKTHPYGGTHHQLKTIQARARAGISILHPSITYPKDARPPAVLSESLLAYFQAVFEGDRRQPPPEAALQALANELTTCPSCKQTHAASRSKCPWCHMRSRHAGRVRVSPAPLRVRRLLQVDGLITQVNVPANGSPIAIVYDRNRYYLLRLNGPEAPDEVPLFSGAAGARFACFQNNLVVNVPARDELMVIEMKATGLHLLETVNSERIEGETIFAATPEALYRLAGGYILRGQVRHGRYLEEILASAYRNRTQLWAAPHIDHLAGHHKLFAEDHFFTLDQSGRQFTFTPTRSTESFPGRITSMGVAWGPKRLAFLWHEKSGGRESHHFQITDLAGACLHHAASMSITPPFERLEGRLVNDRTVLFPTDDGILKWRPDDQVLLSDLASICSANATLHWHPRGLLVQQPHALYLVEAG